MANEIICLVTRVKQELSIDEINEKKCVMFSRDGEKYIWLANAFLDLLNLSDVIVIIIVQNLIMMFLKINKSKQNA